MPRHDTFEALMNRLADGDEDAAQKVWQRFVGPLVSEAHRHLDALTRRKVDAEDVVQSAYRSFFRRHQQGEFDIAGWASVWALLLRITHRKCARRATYFRAQRRDQHCEKPLAADGDEDFGSHPFSREPSPEEQAVMSELLHEVMRDMEITECRILTLSIEGWSCTEISSQVGRAERTVRRVRERVRKRLERIRDNDDSSSQKENHV